MNSRIEYCKMAQKIKIQTIQEIVKEHIPEVKAVIKMPASNTWFFKFEKSEDMTDLVYEKIAELSFTRGLNKDFDRKYKSIMVNLNLHSVNTYYERMLKERS